MNNVFPELSSRNSWVCVCVCVSEFGDAPCRSAFVSSIVEALHRIEFQLSLSDHWSCSGWMSVDILENLFGVPEIAL